MSRKMIFIVDDSDTNLARAEEALEDIYNVMTIPSAAKMFSMLEKFLPDLILLDIEMPQMDGFEALGLLKSDKRFADIPVIFLTSLSDEEVEVRGFEMGVVDFIIKPFSAPVLINRLRTHLDIDGLLRERTARLLNANKNMIFVLADIIENRDANTGGHIERVSEYIRHLVGAMKERGVYEEQLKGLDTDMIVVAALLHDVGKIHISDIILNKPGKLTGDEYEVMKTHAAMGEKVIDQIIMRSGHDDFFYNAKMFAAYHHERWDGKGYPYCLSGEDIPIQGRVMSIADVYDALTSERPYKRAFTDEEAVEIIMKDSGAAFDPAITSIFYAVQDKFKAARIAWEKGELSI